MTDKEKFKQLCKEDSKELDKSTYNKLLKQSEITVLELQKLLDARDSSLIDFYLVDVREDEEHQAGCIEGTDALIPTSSLFPSLEKANLSTNKSLILYCLVGSRSAYAQRLLEQMDFHSIINVVGGISSYNRVIDF